MVGLHKPYSCWRMTFRILDKTQREKTFLCIFLSPTIVELLLFIYRHVVSCCKNVGVRLSLHVSINTNVRYNVWTCASNERIIPYCVRDGVELLSLPTSRRGVRAVIWCTCLFLFGGEDLLSMREDTHLVYARFKRFYFTRQWWGKYIQHVMLLKNTLSKNVYDNNVTTGFEKECRTCIWWSIACFCNPSEPLLYC